MKPQYSATTLVIRTIVRAIRDRRGATVIEYGLILAFVFIAMIIGLTALANTTTDMWGNVSTKVATAK